jgi:hypothetical protein
MATRSVKNRNSLADPRHLLRYLKFQAGGGDETALRAIAIAEKVNVGTIKQSVMMVDGFRKSNTASELDMHVRDLVISSIPKAKETLNSLLSATELVEHKSAKNGRTTIRTVEDKTTRIEALRLLNSFAATMQPKQAPVEVNVNQTNQTANISSAETTEDRFRRLREKAEAFKSLPPIVAGVPENIDAGEEPDDDDEEDDE